MSANEPIIYVRTEPRTNMFVMATIYAGAGSTPVKIRNLSADGALVEGAVLPRPGTPISLARGGLNVAGEVAWCESGRAGLQFHARIRIADWLPNPSVVAPQDRVDAVIQQLKNPAVASPAPGVPFLHRESVEETLRVKMLLEQLSDALAGDPQIVARFGSSLQCLDLAAQLLARFASSGR